MKLLVSADWHIKLGAKNIPITWAINRYKLLFKELYALETQVEKHIILGDIFDKTPSMAELELYFEFISGCTVPTLIIPGNHEADKKNTTFLSNLNFATNSINSLVRIIDDYHTEEGVDFIPYNRLKEFATGSVNFNSSILCTHVRGAIEPHVKPEIDLSLLDSWKVVLAGDLHSYSNSQRNILYPGSPVTTSFHRKPVETGVIIFDTANLQHKWQKLNVPQLLRKTLKVGEEPVATEYDHTIYEVEGDIVELSNLIDNALVDKKIIKRDLNTSLELNPELTLAEEVSEYLQVILEVPINSIEEILKELADYENQFK